MNVMKQIVKRGLVIVAAAGLIGSAIYQVNERRSDVERRTAGCLRSWVLNPNASAAENRMKLEGVQMCLQSAGDWECTDAWPEIFTLVCRRDGYRSFRFGLRRG
jgi:hypothetical protein